MLEKEEKKKEESRARDEEKVCEEAKKQAAVEQIQEQIQGEKRDQMLQAVSAHNEAQMREKVQKQLEEKPRDLELIEAQKEDNRLYFERESQKAKSARARNIQFSDGNVKLHAQRRAIQEQQRKEAKEAEKRQAKALAAEEKEFKEYAERELQKARASGRIVLNTNKAPSRLENKCKDDRPQSFLPPINSSPPPAYIHCESAGAKCTEALPKTEAKGTPHIVNLTLGTPKANGVPARLTCNKLELTNDLKPSPPPQPRQKTEAFRHMDGPTAADTREPLLRYSTRETRRIRRKQDSCALLKDFPISSAPYRGGFTKYDTTKTYTTQKLQLAKDLKPSPPPQPKKKTKVFRQRRYIHPQ
ncbi:myosin-10-like [Xyrichtys novacula]|uniref:Myosin-10-like n=1 Tax=Xyrichtys novacula TaxID=13765 RepID=A0AAV1GLD8_XYRNO|nr:myosin-10-like [Xyrichtys novacula]